MPELRTNDGLTLTYYEWGGEHRGAQAPVVLQHGFIVNTDMNWVQSGVVDALVAAGRHVVGIDARGHGASSAPHDSAFYGEEKMAADLSTLYDLLGFTAVHQVGYSMGSIVSLIAASRDPRIERLVVGGVGAAVVELGGVDTRVTPNDVIVDALTTDDPSTITDHGGVAFRFLADVVGADRLALLAQGQMMHASPIALDAISAPTLVIAGADDPLSERPDVLAAAIPHGTLRIVTGDHFTALMDPDAVTTIVEFLSD